MKNKFVRMLKALVGISSDTIAYELWDMSAICNHFETLKVKLKTGSKNIIVVPEYVIRQMFEQSLSDMNCSKIHSYLINYTGNKLQFAVTPIAYRGKCANEQMLAIMEYYGKKYYDITLYTDDVSLVELAKTSQYTFLVWENEYNDCNEIEE